MKNLTNLSSDAIEHFKKTYNVLATLRLANFDHDFTKLEDLLQSTYKYEYAHNDRYIIEHSDTDYYLPGCPYGLSIFNLVRVFLYLDIPLYTLLFITNHRGISKEFEFLIPKNMHEHNFPTIIDNCLTVFSNTRTGHNMCTGLSVDVDSIIKHGVSMIGVQRIHRNILFNELKRNNLLNKISVSYNGANNVS